MTMVVSPGQRRALVYGPVSVLHGLAVAWIANPGLSHTAIAVSLVVAVGTFVAHLLFAAFFLAFLMTLRSGPSGPEPLPSWP